MGVFVNGDFRVSACGVPAEVFSIDEACQRVRFILSTEKGSYIYNREFGADLAAIRDSVLSGDELNKLAEIVCREAMAEQKEISVERVRVLSDGERNTALSVMVGYGGRIKFLEVALV